MRPSPASLRLAAAVLLLSACGDGPSGPGESFDPVGTLRFQYAGAMTGRYEAVGALEFQPGEVPQPATGATAYREGDLTGAVAVRLRSGGRGDYFALMLGEVTRTGSFSLDPTACQQETLASCRVGFFAPDLDPSEIAGVEDLTTLAGRAYVLALGNVTVSHRSSTRLRGTFQGIAVPGEEASLQNMITITAGEFDLPIRPR